MSNHDDAASLLFEMIDRLSKADIPYMIAGSYAVLIHGQPRTTQDIDLVIEPTSKQIEILIASVTGNKYVSPEAARDAFAQRSMFNVIDTETGWKVDLIVRKSRPFSIEEFGRRRVVEFLGQRVFVVSPEDSILSKLEWARKGNSERQLRDAESVAALQWKTLDFPYLQRWAEELDVENELRTILQRAGVLQSDLSET